MGQSLSQKRPWLAALLGVLATGLGHAYLRRWWRAVGWVGTLVAATVLFVDTAVIEAAMNGSSFDLLAAAPVLVVASLSAADAYLLAHAQNAAARVASQTGKLTHCPNCGKELDPDLAFCQWCSTVLPHSEENGAEVQAADDS